MTAILLKIEKIKCFICGQRIKIGQEGFNAELDKKRNFIYRHQNCQLWERKENINING